MSLRLWKKCNFFPIALGILFRNSSWKQKYKMKNSLFSLSLFPSPTQNSPVSKPHWCCIRDGDSASLQTPTFFLFIIARKTRKWNPVVWSQLTRWLNGKESTRSAGDTGDAGSICGSGRCPGSSPGNPLQYSCWENPMDREAQRTSVHRVPESRIQLKWLSPAQSEDDGGKSLLFFSPTFLLLVSPESEISYMNVHNNIKG